MSEIAVDFDDTPGRTTPWRSRRNSRARQARRCGSYGCIGPPLRARVSDEPSGDYGRQDADGVLAAVVASVDDVDVTVEPIAGVAAADALHAVAERRGAALVVVRSTDRGRVGRALPRSTGERLLHGAPCAVAVTPARLRKALRWDRDRRRRLRRL
jgi:nucleotide-binding universal stress UspA family protein